MTAHAAKILVLTQDDDPTADVVLNELNDRALPFVRCDPGDFPTTLRLTAELDPKHMSWVGSITGQTQGMDLQSIRAVYYRRPTESRFAMGMSEPEQRFAASQARHAISGVLAGLPEASWLNHPSAMADARVKPYQLAVATGCGLDTPETLITNEPAVVRDFATRVGGRIITKALAMVNISEDSRSGVIYTAEVAEEMWSDPAIGSTAHLFQRLVPGVDVRLTAVGGRLYAAAIQPNDKAGPIDIRAHHENVRYELVDVPDMVHNAVLAMLKKLGLVFGAFDFRITPDNGWVFIELNPNGQWAFIPELRAPISGAIADVLERASE